MLLYTLKRLVYVMPVAIGVSIACFLLVHIAPGDPLTAILPADATLELQEQMRAAYGFDKPLPVQYALLVLAGRAWRSRHLDRHRPSRSSPKSRARSRNTLILAIGGDADRLRVGTFFGFVAGYFRAPGSTSSPRRSR